MEHRPEKGSESHSFESDEVDNTEKGSLLNVIYWKKKKEDHQKGGHRRFQRPRSPEETLGM